MPDYDYSIFKTISCTIYLFATYLAGIKYL